MTLASGESFIGAAHISDFAVKNGDRDLVLQEPILRVTKAGEHKRLKVHRVVISESEISLMYVTYERRENKLSRWHRGGPSA